MCESDQLKLNKYITRTMIIKAKKSGDGDRLSSFLTYNFMTSNKSPWASISSFANETRIPLLLECFGDKMEYRALRL